MKKFFSLIGMTLVLSSLLFEKDESQKQYLNRSYKSKENSLHNQYLKGSNQSKLNHEAHLSKQEQQFALNLSPTHRTVFSTIFSKAQRIESMSIELSENKGPNQNGNLVSPDEAVELVIKNARISVPEYSEVVKKSYKEKEEKKENKERDYYYPFETP